MSIMVCSVVCFSQAMNQDKRDKTCVKYLYLKKTKHFRT